MTVVAIETHQRPVPAELEQEILARIDRAGLHICEAELRYKLRWDERNARLAARTAGRARARRA